MIIRPWCLFFLGQILLSTSHPYAMEVEQYEYTPLDHADLEAIELYVMLGKSTDGRPVFNYPVADRATHKVFYFSNNVSAFDNKSSVDVNNTLVFAIDNGKALSYGNKSEIRQGEQIYFSTKANGDTTLKTRNTVVKILSKQANCTVSAEMENEVVLLDFMLSLRGDYGRRGYFEDDNYRYLFSDYVPKRSLEDLLTEDLSDDARNSIAIAVILGIVRLHSIYSILHNDIKSGNIMLENHRGTWIATPIDFGQSCFMNRAARVLCGSPGYRGSELLSASKRYPQSIQTDYYMLGIVIFEILESLENNFQNYIVTQKKSSDPFEWDLNRKDFPLAFPSSCGLDVNVDPATLRGQLIILAKQLTGPIRDRPTPDDLIDWLKERDVDVSQLSVDINHIIKVAEFMQAYYEARHERRHTDAGAEEKAPERARSRSFSILKKVGTPTREKVSLANSFGVEGQSPRTRQLRKGHLPSMSRSSPSSGREKRNSVSPKNSDDIKPSMSSSPGSSSSAVSPLPSRSLISPFSSSFLRKEDET